MTAHNIRCIVSESVLYHQKVEHQWKSRSYTSCNITMMMRTLPELWPLHDIILNSEKDRWRNHALAPDASEGKTLNTCAKHIERLESWNRRKARAELRTNECLRFCELPDSPTPVFQSQHHPQREARTTSIVESSVIMPNNVTRSAPGHVHHPQHNHGQTDRGLKQKKINHGEVIRTLMAGDIRRTCGTHQSTTTGGGYLNTRRTFTRDRWSQLILLVIFMTHTTRT